MDADTYSHRLAPALQFKETPESLEEKKGVNLTALTPGSAYSSARCPAALSLTQASSPLRPPVHGYSMLRPLLNNAYFHDLHDKAELFGIEVEGHHTETGPGVFEVRAPSSAGRS